jgi:Spy/CpxP family protein refolding chaperone
MKRQLFAIVAGSLLLVSPIISKVATAQTTPAPTKTERSGEWKQLKQSLNLTADQQATLKQIRQTSRTQMESVLTDAQKTQLAAEKAAHKANPASGKKDGNYKGHNGWKSLNLTDAQKAQIKSIWEAAKSQTDAVYTPQQKAIMQQFRASHPRKEKTTI